MSKLMTFSHPCNKRFKSPLTVQFPITFGKESTEPATVGTHTLRKMGHLFAVWGSLKCAGISNDAVALNVNALAADISRCAHHKGVSQKNTGVRMPAQCAIQCKRIVLRLHQQSGFLMLMWTLTQTVGTLEHSVLLKMLFVGSKKQFNGWTFNFID